jgi:hypothetical protein
LRIAFSSIPWSQIKDVISSVGVLGTLTLGTIGLTTWWRQLRGTSKYDVARRAVLHAYKVQDAIQAFRNPMMSLPKKDVEEGRELQAEMRIYEERMQALVDKWIELRTISREARVFWREEVDPCFKPIEALIGELRGAKWLHFWMKGAYAALGSMVDDSPARVAANNKVMYQTSDDDEFSKKVNAAVAQIELFFDKHIK